MSFSPIGKITKIIVHNTASDRDTTKFETIRKWHLEKGWADIGYHYVITGDGKMHLGRPETAMGAHAVGHNSNTLGVCVTGNFDLQKPLDKQIHTLVQVLAALCRRHGLQADDIIGHRDVNATSCPGKNMYARLPEIREKVSKYL